MTTYDETIYNPNQATQQSATAKALSQPKENKFGQWQTVTIGGVAGIVMGMAASHAYDALASNSSEEVADDNTATDDANTTATSTSEVHQATVSQNLSFGQAFAAARAEVGTGGVFLWHGQLYNTFTAEEWNAMSDAEKDEFATEVQPLLAQQTPDVHTTATTTTTTTEPHHVDNVTTGGEVQVVEEQHDQTPEVHFLGVQRSDVDGRMMNFGTMTVGNVNVALVDVDDDQVFDIRWADVNNNREVEDNEIADISAENLSVEDFQLLSDLEQQQTNGTSAQAELAHTQQEDLAPDMPDYMNDADVSLA